MKFFDLSLGGLSSKAIYYDGELRNSSNNGKCRLSTYTHGSDVSNCLHDRGEKDLYSHYTGHDYCVEQYSLGIKPYFNPDK